MWNNFVKPEDEKKLPKSVREKPHITLGSIGDDIYSFNRLGSLAELLEWFGLDDFNFEKDDLFQPVNKVIGMTGPHIKLPFEIAMGQSFFPNPFKPTKSRDRWEIFFNSFGVNDFYKMAAGKPNKGIKEVAIRGVMYKYDYKDSAYNEIMSLKRTFQGNDEVMVSNTSDKSNSLYYMKQSMRYGDKEKAVKYMNDYFKFGGTANGLSKSIAFLDPMYGFLGKETKEKGKRFVAGLNKEEKIRLKIAMDYFEKELQIPEVLDRQLRKKNIKEDEAKNAITKYINATTK
jgi:hypothetical protein